MTRKLRNLSSTHEIWPHNIVPVVSPGVYSGGCQDPFSLVPRDRIQFKKCSRDKGDKEKGKETDVCYCNTNKCNLSEQQLITSYEHACRESLTLWVKRKEIFGGNRHLYKKMILMIWSRVLRHQMLPIRKPPEALRPNWAKETGLFHQRSLLRDMYELSTVRYYSESHLDWPLDKDREQ